MTRDAAIVEVKNLNVDFGEPGSSRHVVKNVSFSIAPGESVGLVGESGSGKSVTVRTLLGLYADNEHVQAETYEVFGKSAREYRDKDWRNLRGDRIGFVLQDALTSLDPLKTIGYQVAESINAHGKADSKETSRRVVKLLDSVGIPQPEIRQHQYSHELSGGLRQRALIAGAIANAPQLIIADEPTTALDVTVQAQVLELLKSYQRDGSALLLVSHDLAVVASVCDRILVMKHGEIVEEGSADEILHHPKREYTKLLLAAVPSAKSRGRRLSSIQHEPLPLKHIDYRHNLIHAEHVSKTYHTHRIGTVHAVADAGVDLFRGETLGIVGESGSGKSTFAKVLAGLVEPTEGTVTLEGSPWSPLPEKQRRARRQEIQVISQDPISSFDPRYTVAEIIAEPLKARKTLTKKDIELKVHESLDLVQLPGEYAGYRPSRLSGGQRQRVAIARALAVNPSVLVADEAVSALDVSIQAQILDLLADIQAKTQVGIVFISHDLGVVHHIADDVIVMKDGRIVEHGEPDQVFEHPSHPYTKRLIAALPKIPEEERMPL
ncbi:ABC transporter ATP-binding protein [Bifidobacterium thermacidophilum]|uniref:ABC transporter ATP-binding protein n=1 Tax=Bifidobacterium thermacidophilum TaxID=246618 RepID=A0ABW8KSB6_9BIFI